MKINQIRQNTPSFAGGANNKILLKGLEKIADHGATFAAGVSFLAAVGLRPLAIALTPGVDKENKKYSSANSIASGVTKLAVAGAMCAPIECAVKKIDENPDLFLKKETIENFKSGAKSLLNSRDYKFATGALKQSSGFFAAIPKSIITAALIPVVVDKILNFKKTPGAKAAAPCPKTISARPKYPSVFNPVIDKTPFAGSIINKIAQGEGKILDTKFVQKFAKKHSKNEANIARNVSVATDLLLTGMSAFEIKKSNKIENERKNPLIYNSVLSTAASILFGVKIDDAIQKSGKNSIDKFINANKNNPKLSKYLEGINILRPTIIFALIYYGLLPMATTFLADKIDKTNASKTKAQ